MVFVGISPERSPGPTGRLHGLMEPSYTRKAFRNEVRPPVGDPLDALSRMVSVSPVTALIYKSSGAFWQEHGWVPMSDIDEDGSGSYTDHWNRTTENIHSNVNARLDLQARWNHKRVGPGRWKLWKARGRDAMSTELTPIWVSVKDLPASGEGVSGNLWSVLYETSVQFTVDVVAEDGVLDRHGVMVPATGRVQTLNVADRMGRYLFHDFIDARWYFYNIAWPKDVIRTGDLWPVLWLEPKIAVGMGARRWAL